MAETFFRSKAPERRSAILWSSIFALIGAIAFFSGGWTGWLLVFPCVVLASILLLAVVAPSFFLYGAKLCPGGFEFHAPLRRPALIAFRHVTRIDAVSIRDGDTGMPFVDFIVQSDKRSVRLTEGLLHESGLLKQFELLPGFDAEAFGRALRHEPSDFMEPFGKRFRVLALA